MTDAPVVVHRIQGGVVHPAPRSAPVDPSVAQPNCLVVAGDKVLAVGTEAQLRETGAPWSNSPELVDHEGAAILPGLIDAHIHALSLATALVTVDLREARTRDEALVQLRGAAERLEPGAWLFGGRWNVNEWSGPGPDRASLDSVTGDHPAILPSIDGHSAWVNSAALRAARVDRHTTDPAGGVIERDASGEPTGILRENACDLVWDVADGLAGSMSGGAADATPAVLDGLVRAQQHLLSLGLTGIHDIDGEDARAGFLELERQGALGIRVHKCIPLGALDTAIGEGRRTGEGSVWLNTGPVKIFSDGALGSCSCHMKAPFAGTSSMGMAVTEDREIAQAARRAVSHGIGVATHAIGDRANERVLDIYSALAGDARLATALIAGPKLRIEHAQHLQRHDIMRMAGLGVIASMQPVHATSDMDVVDRLLGERDVASYAWRSVLRAGGLLAFGSDAPVETANPFEALYAATTRQRADGSPAGGWQAEEVLTIGEALAAHTVGSAAAANQAHRVGTLRPGMLADFIVVDTDPYAASAAALRTTLVQETWTGGQPRYRRSQ